MAMECANFERIYDEHSGLVYRTAYGVLANPAQAQDVVQDVFMRLWRRPPDFDDSRGPLPNYLRLLARSRALDMWPEPQGAGRAPDRMRVRALREEARADDRPALPAELRRRRSIVLRALAQI